MDRKQAAAAETLAAQIDQARQAFAAAIIGETATEVEQLANQVRQAAKLLKDVRQRVKKLPVPRGGRYDPGDQLVSEAEAALRRAVGLESALRDALPSTPPDEP